MKIRTITGFLYLQNFQDSNALKEISQKLETLKKGITSIETQFLRVSFQNLGSILKKPLPEIIESMQVLEKQCNDVGLELINIGTLKGKTLTVENIKILTKILESTEWVFGSVLIDRWDEDIFRACGKVYKNLAKAWPNGLANIKYSTLFNVPPFSPFYPSAYHDSKKSSFALGLEWGEELIEASEKANTIPELTKETTKRLEKKLKPLEKKLIIQSKKLGLSYKGIDLSLATSLGKVSTLPTVWKNMGVEFGAPGSLAIARAITQAIEETNIKKCGYSGLMIPVMEDQGLARISKKLTIHELLLYSSVCGTGLDTIPLPGDMCSKKIAKLLQDIYMLSDKWNKPLSARLFPIPGKKKGDCTKMNCPHLVDAYVM